MEIHVTNLNCKIGLEFQDQNFFSCIPNFSKQLQVAAVIVLSKKWHLRRTIDIQHFKMTTLADEKSTRKKKREKKIRFPSAQCIYYFKRMPVSLGNFVISFHRLRYLNAGIPKREFIFPVMALILFLFAESIDVRSPGEISGDNATAWTFNGAIILAATKLFARTRNSTTRRNNMQKHGELHVQD